MEQNMIAVKNLSKEFKGQRVLKEVTMNIPENCVTGSWVPTVPESLRC